MTPTSFKLGGNTWRVKLQKAIVVVTPAGEVQHLYGECNIDTYTIRIARTVEGKPCTPETCLLYTSPSPRDGLLSRMPSSA